MIADFLIRPPGFRPIVMALFLAVIFLSGACSDEENDPITVRVFSYGTDYTGTYILNGGDTLALPSGTETEISGLYYGELILEDVDEVTVDVTTNGKANALAVRVYRDDEKVKDGNAVAETEPEELTVSLTYDYDDEEEDE